MKAKEKAQEMADDFYNIDTRPFSEYGDQLSDEVVKQCALIAVEELLNQSWDYGDSASYNSWLEVKKELEKL